MIIDPRTRCKNPSLKMLMLGGDAHVKSALLSRMMSTQLDSVQLCIRPINNEAVQLSIGREASDSGTIEKYIYKIAPIGVALQEVSHDRFHKYVRDSGVWPLTIEIVDTPEIFCSSQNRYYLQDKIREANVIVIMVDALLLMNENSHNIVGYGCQIENLTWLLKNTLPDTETFQRMILFVPFICETLVGETNVSVQEQISYITEQYYMPLIGHFKDKMREIISMAILPVVAVPSESTSEAQFIFSEQPLIYSLAFLLANYQAYTSSAYKFRPIDNLIWLLEIDSLLNSYPKYQECFAKLRSKMMLRDINGFKILQNPLHI